MGRVDEGWSKKEIEIEKEYRELFKSICKERDKEIKKSVDKCIKKIEVMKRNRDIELEMIKEKSNNNKDLNKKDRKWLW